MNVIHILFALMTCVIQQVQCFLVSAQTSNQQQISVLKDSEGCTDSVHNDVRSISLDQKRRNAMTGTTTLLSLPFFRDKFGTQQYNTFGLKGINSESEALLQGDFIVRNLWLNRLYA